jgi:hypothetical protein
MAKKAVLSEVEAKFRANWGPEECLEHLRLMAKKNEGRHISRAFFRKYSAISDATWNRYFGTFHEFRRQAGLELSRHAHRLELNIAKHASVDGMRAVGHDKALWEGKFLRPRDARFQMAAVCCDMHDKNCDPFWRKTFIDTVKRAQPDKIVINGDGFDLPEFSKHPNDPRDWDFKGRWLWMQAFLRDLRDACPNAEIIFVEGNHEFRLLRHLAEADPAMKVLLADLLGHTVSSLLGLDKFEVNFIARADLSAWTERDIRRQLERNYVTLWDCLLFGHFPEMRKMGMPGANGHHHRHYVWGGEYSPIFGPYEWHQIGCGHERRASYTNAEQWSNGFLLAHVDTHRKRTQLEYFDVTHDHAFIGGKLHLRDKPSIK